MSTSFQGNNLGAFLPTTTVFDAGRLDNINVNSPEFKELLVQLMQAVNNIALMTNIKETGYYYTNQPFVNGQIYFPNPLFTSSTAQAPAGRQVVRWVVNTGALTSSSTTTVPHNIPFSANLTATRLFGAATAPGVGFTPIPNSDINLRVTSTDVVITTSADYSAYTISSVVIEYLTS